MWPTPFQLNLSGPGGPCGIIGGLHPIKACLAGHCRGKPICLTRVQQTGVARIKRGRAALPFKRPMATHGHQYGRLARACDLRRY